MPHVPHHNLFWIRLAEHVQDGQPAYVAIVAENSRHSPGTRGARMFVRPDLSTFGTIGGGVMEHEVIAHARAMFERGELEPPRLETLVHRKKAHGDAKTSGLMCAGWQKMVYFTVEPGTSTAQAVLELAARAAEDRAGELSVTSAGLAVSDRPVLPDVAPIRLEEPLHYTEQILNPMRAAIFGGGHCGLALSKVLAELGYIVTVVETRPDVFTFVDNAWARHKIVVDDYVEGGERISHPEMTHLIVMTADRNLDVRALLGSIALPFPYKGVMGSPAKIASIKAELTESGIDASLCEQLYAPIGLEMTSNTPQEIAISIAAQLLREREVLFPWTRPAS